MSSTLGKNIKAYRKNKGLTQEELEESLEYFHKSVVNKLESKESLQTRTLEKVADVLGISFGKLMGFE